MFPKIPEVDILYFVYVILLGLILGSFVGLAVVRIPEGESLVRPRSHCRKCGHTLSWFENIPIFSYLALRGKCRQCEAQISPRYLIIELVTTLLTVFAFWKIQPWQRFVLFQFLLIFPLILLMFLDWFKLILPDAITLPGIAFGFLAHFLDGKFFQFPSLAPSTFSLLLDSLLGALAGSLTLFLLALAYQKLRKREGLGGGDVKLAAMLGAFFGWKAVFFIFFLASVAGTLFGVLMIVLKRFSKETPLPFGSFLSAAALLYLFYGELLLSAYLGLFKINYN